MNQTNIKFDSAGQKFGCLNPIIINPIIFWLDNFGKPNQIAIWLSRPLQNVESAYKMCMSVLFLKLSLLGNQ